jgi:hypothetical protein
MLTSAGVAVMPMSQGSVTGRMSISTSPMRLAWHVAQSIASTSDRVRRMLNPAAGSLSPSKGPLIDESHARQARRDGVAVGAVKNSTTAGVRTSGFTLCVCPGSSR